MQLQHKRRSFHGGIQRPAPSTESIVIRAHVPADGKGLVVCQLHVLHHEIDRLLPVSHGHLIFHGVTVISPAVTPEGLKKADYMRICFAMLESADTAVFLPDWEDSPGAQLEKHWCEYVGKKMVFLMEGAE